MTKNRVHIDAAGLKGKLHEIAQRIEQADQSFRKAHAGKPAADLVEPASRAFGDIGVDLQQHDVEAYVRTVELNEPFEFRFR